MSNRTKFPDGVILLFPTIFGLVFAVIGVLIGWNGFDLYLNGEEASGQVVGFVETTCGSGRPAGSGPCEARTVQFTTNDGVQVIFTEEMFHGGTFDRTDDQTVQVKYNPDDPLDAAINDASGIWILPIIFIAFGTIAFGAGVVGYLVLLKRRLS